MLSPEYRGRFAPSPTGPLHFGSLVSAMASFLESRIRHGKWLVRIDDLDQTRQVNGMDLIILKTLEAFGFEWHGAVSYQSQTTLDYQKALKQLEESGHTYVCQCSRSQIKAIARIGLEGPVYPDTCRDLELTNTGNRAIRLKTGDELVCFEDGLYGHQCQRIHQEVGDFVIKRADSFFAYQLAVVVDDHKGGINHVVRGADLLPSTARQIYLQKLLGFTHPVYLHVPLVLDSDGRKLSKTDQAHPVDAANPVASLLDAWHFLNQEPPPADCGVSLPDFWDWGTKHWDPKRMLNSNEPAL